jgi:hypothetical protein
MIPEAIHTSPYEQFFRTLWKLAGRTDHEQFRDEFHAMCNVFTGAEGYEIIRSTLSEWHGDLLMFCAEGDRAVGFKDRFFRRVAIPILRSWRAYKLDDWRGALKEIEACSADDWRDAIRCWVEERRAWRKE